MNRLPVALIDRNTDLTLGKALRWLWRHAFSRRRRLQGAFVLALMFVGAIAELFTIGAVIPFLAVFADPGGFHKTSRFASMFVSIGLTPSHFTLKSMGLLFCGIAVFAAIIRIVLAWISQKYRIPDRLRHRDPALREDASPALQFSHQDQQQPNYRNPRKHSETAHGNVHSDHAGLHCVCDRIDDRHRPHPAGPGSCDRGVRGLSCDLFIHFACHSASTPTQRTDHRSLPTSRAFRRCRRASAEFAMFSSTMPRTSTCRTSPRSIIAFVGPRALTR